MSHQQLPSRVTMPLLDLITAQSLEEDYAHVARRRALDAPQSTRGRPQRIAAVVVGIFGLLATTAAVQTAQDADETQASRVSLLSRIDERRTTVAALQERTLRLQDGIEEVRTGLAQATDLAVTAQSLTRRLQVRTGYLAVSGEGVRARVTDGSGENTEVRDAELRLLVNGLWEAGAEAIAVNGQRLTTLSSITNSGPVINVNSVPLNPPYVVEAIGDRRTLQSGLVESTGGERFAAAASAFGFGFEMDSVERLDLPAAVRKPLRHVSQVEPDQPRAAEEEGPA